MRSKESEFRKSGCMDKLIFYAILEVLLFLKVIKSYIAVSCDTQGFDICCLSLALHIVMPSFRCEFFAFL